MSLRSPLLAVGLGALLLAGCGSDDSALIPSGDAERLSALVVRARDAASAGQCDRARRTVGDAESQLSGLPRNTSRRLKQNLREWLDHLDARIADECEAPQPEETSAPEATEAPTEEPTVQPTEEPTVEPTEEPTVTVDPGTGGSQEEPPETGGVAPGDG